jgi:UDP-N-acetylmuramate dehydrogenase
LDRTDQSTFEGSLREKVPLAPMTTLGIGGSARYFSAVKTSEQIAAGVQWAADRGLPLFVLGGGSNIVVADEGVSGLALRIDIKGVENHSEGDRMIVTAGAGEEWESFVAGCAEAGWAGIECLSGIPGRVGATPIQNVGAYGQETSETLVRLSALDRQSGEMVEIDSSECQFGYRTSRFKTSDANRFVVTAVTFSLQADGKPTLRYPELIRHLREQGIWDPGIADVRRAVIELRRRKAMVIDPFDSDSRSVGSFFVNPVVSQSEFERIRTEVGGGAAGSMPAFPQEDGKVKLSAAWLIERAGIRRGFVFGNVGTSTKHALAIVNRGGGTAREVIELKTLIQKRVRDKFGIELVPEPVFVGVAT